MPYLVREYYLGAAEAINFVIHMKTYIQPEFIDNANNSISGNLCPVSLYQMAINLNRKSSATHF